MLIGGSTHGICITTTRYGNEPTKATHTHFTSDKGHTHTDTPTLEGRQSRADQLTGWASSGALSTHGICITTTRYGNEGHTHAL